jgi:hypothetical protein
MLIAILMLYFTSDVRLLSDEQLIATHVVQPSTATQEIAALRSAESAVHTFNLMALAAVGQLPNSPDSQQTTVWLGMSLETLGFSATSHRFCYQSPGLSRYIHGCLMHMSKLQRQFQ